MRSYYKPKITFSTRYAIHGPTKKGHYYFIPWKHLGDPQPNCREIRSDWFSVIHKNIHAMHRAQCDAYPLECIL